MTEPSGHGEFAEAMRELIADLRPTRRAFLLLRGGGHEISSNARARPALALVR